MPVEQNSISQVASNALHDLRSYLTVIGTEHYQVPIELLSRATIGQHTRHIIEFFSCLLEQGTNLPDPVINYAIRRRDYLIESNTEHALKAVDDISAKLNSLDTEINCMLDCSEHGQPGLLVPSTIGRELIYTIEHTIHHLAIVKIALKSILPSLEIPEHFGVAPSTLRHRLEACAQ